MSTTSPRASETFVNRLLNTVERIGNKLPDPMTFFIIASLAVLMGSQLAVTFHWEAVDPIHPDQIVRARSLLTSEGLRWVFLHVVENFTTFPPLGVVLAVMLGVGIAERSGLLSALMKLVVLATPRALLTPAVILVGMVGHVAADAAFIVLPPLAGLVFLRAGRSPVVGIAAAVGGVAAGFSANLLPSGIDLLLQSLTQDAAHLVDPQYQVSVLCNYYFLATSAIVLTLVGWAATKFFVERRFNDAQIQEQIDCAGLRAMMQGDDRLNSSERWGITGAMLAFLVTGAIILTLTCVSGGPLEGTYLRPPLSKPVPVWSDALVPILMALFLFPGLAYGIAAKSIRNDRDVAKMLADTMATMGPYIVLAFVAGQFVAWFRESNLGRLIAIGGVDLLSHLNLSPAGLVVAIILVVSFLNIFMVSASAKWALLAVVFVPLFMGLGLSPELTQISYRVGDSCTNAISPFNPYLVIILVFIQKYLPKAGFGTLVALMLPYTITFLIVWTLLLLLWMWVGIPLGPGGGPMFVAPMQGG